MALNISKFLLLSVAVILLTGSVSAADVVAHYRATGITGSESPPDYGLRLDGFYDANHESVVTFSFDNVFLDEFNDNTIRLSGTITVVKSTGSGHGRCDDDDDEEGDDDDEKGESHEDDYDDAEDDEEDCHGSRSGQYVGTRYFLEVDMKEVTDPDSIANIVNYNPSWKYYTIVSDGVELENLVDSTDHARLWTYPVDGSKPFQIGDGANGKNANFGASGWLSFEHVIGSMVFGNGPQGHFRSSDFLMDLSPVTDVVESDPSADLPARYELRGNYPNPFNPSTTIEYTLPKRSRVSITIFNTLGQHVRELVDSDQSAGEHFVEWDGMDNAGSAVPTGIYFYRIVADSFTDSRKMLLLK